MQVSGSSVVSPYSLPPPPQDVRTGWLVGWLVFLSLLHEMESLPTWEGLWADVGKKIQQKDQRDAGMCKNVCICAVRLCLSLPLLL